MRASLNQRFDNAQKHRLGLLKHFAIPEPDHAVATSRKIARALQVVQKVVRMLTAVDLHDQPCADADEIHYVFADRLLSPEAIFAEMPIAQLTPQTTFGVTCICA